MPKVTNEVGHEVMQSTDLSRTKEIIKELLATIKQQNIVLDNQANKMDELLAIAEQQSTLIDNQVNEIDKLNGRIKMLELDKEIQDD